MSLSQIPPVGLGLWKVPNDACADVVYDAIRIGYRHFDCACDYGNEVEVGEGISRAIADGLVSREDLWITSKLWNTYHAREHVKPALEKTLSDLGLDYLDLYLIHFPIAQAFVEFDDRYPPEWIFDPEAENPAMKLAPVSLQETWQAMETLVDEGLSRHIGVCNYNSGLFNDLLAYSRIKPFMLQIESHPYLTQERLIRLATQNGVKVTAFSPFGSMSYIELNMDGNAVSLFEQEAIVQAAERTDRTPAQVLLRWGIQRGCAVIPKSSNSERLLENLSVMDFVLNDEEMKAISALNQNRRFNDPGDFCEGAFNTFLPIYD